MQYLAGLVIYLFVSPFLSITILLYALYHLNHFSWGKTRRAISDESDSKAASVSEQQSEKNAARTEYRALDEEASIGLERPERVYLESSNQST
jgi:chitin synthase